MRSQLRCSPPSKPRVDAKGRTSSTCLWLGSPEEMRAGLSSHGDPVLPARAVTSVKGIHHQLLARAAGNEHQVFLVVRLRKECAPKAFRLDNHDPTPIFPYVPIQRRVLPEHRGDELDFTGLTVKQNAVTRSYLLAGLICEFHRPVALRLPRNSWSSPESCWPFYSTAVNDCCEQDFTYITLPGCPTFARIPIASSISTPRPANVGNNR